MQYRGKKNLLGGYMQKKRTFGMGAVIVGAIMLVFSYIIKEKVLEGEGQIARAKDSVSQGQGLFNMSPVTKPLGDQLVSGANKKISAGEADVEFYSTVANVLMIGGIILIVVGGASVLFGKKSAR